MPKTTKFAILSLFLISGLFLSTSALAAEVGFKMHKVNDKTAHTVLMGQVPLSPAFGKCNFPDSWIFSCATDQSGKLGAKIVFLVDGVIGPSLTITVPSAGDNLILTGGDTPDYTITLSQTKWDGKSDLNVTINFVSK